MSRGLGQGRGGPRQGDGGPVNCHCPSCSYTATHYRGTPCTARKCPNCGTTLIGA